MPGILAGDEHLRWLRTVDDGGEATEREGGKGGVPEYGELTLSTMSSTARPEVDRNVDGELECAAGRRR